jgi:two-component system cell cycle sensor histidine kinase/response regulator CckA
VVRGPEAILEAVPPDSHPADNWRGSGLVLVVDDEDPVLRFATGMLTTLGFDVVAATDGPRAVEVFQQHRDQLALVLLDLTVPGMEGDDLLSVMRRERPDIPVVLSSGYDAADQDARFAGFLQKPYRLEDMRAILRNALTTR